MPVYPIQTNMSRGEATPYLHDRVDSELYRGSLAKARNVILSRYGGAVRAPGTIYDGPAKNADKPARFLRFEFSRTQVYAIEAGHQYFRFWTATGRVETGGSPVEVATPYTEDDLENIKYRQSGDVVYLFCAGIRPRILRRNSETSWDVLSYIPLDGPYLPLNNTATRLTPAATANLTQLYGGTVASNPAAEASFPASNAFDGDVGSLASWGSRSGWLSYTFTGAARAADGYWITAGSVGGVAPATWKFEGYDGSNWIVLDARSGEGGWGGGETRFYSFINETAYEAYRLSWSGNNDSTLNITQITELGIHQTVATQTAFNLVASSTTGINGGTGFTSSDVDRPIRLLASNSRWYWAQITDRVNATTVKIKLYEHALPDLTPIVNWKLGAWSENSGWPAAVAIYEDRLVGARTDTDPLGVWASVNADYDNFRTSVPLVDDDGISVRLTGGSLNDIGWLLESRDLVGGTAGSLRAIGRNDRAKAVGPSNIGQRLETVTPSSKADPVSVDNVLLFIDLFQQRLYEASYTYEVEGYIAQELSTMNEHLFASGVAEVVYASHPNKVVFIRRLDGKVIAFTYDREQKVAGGALLDFGGVVESIMTLPGATGTDVWMIVRRVVGGNTVRYVERMAEVYREDFTVQGVPIYAACAHLYSGASTTTVSGLDALEGEVVGVLADGRDIGDATVDSGSITLPHGVSAEEIVIGKRMLMDIETLRLSQIGNSDGSGLGRKVSIVEAKIGLYETAGLRLGSKSQLDDMRYEAQIEENPDAPTPLYTGTLSLHPDDSWSNAGVFVIQSESMLPATIRSITLGVEGEP